MTDFEGRDWLDEPFNPDEAELNEYGLDIGDLPEDWVDWSWLDFMEWGREHIPDFDNDSPSGSANA